MARKKKTEAEKFDEKVVMKEEFYDLEPTVVVGSHLTVTTYPDGRTELKWDDAALERDVREAIASVEVKPKTKKKNVKNKQEP